MQQAGRGEEGDRFVFCGLRALPGGSAATGPIHSPQEQHQDLPSTPTLLTLPPVWDLASPQCPGRSEMPRSTRGSCGGHPHDGMEGGFWDGALATSRAGSGHFCSLLKSPDRPQLFPAGKAELEELKPVQDPALAPLGSLRWQFTGNSLHWRDHEQDWGLLSLPGDITSHEAEGKNSRKGPELV